MSSEAGSLGRTLDEATIKKGRRERNRDAHAYIYDGGWGMKRLDGNKREGA